MGIRKTATRAEVSKVENQGMGWLGQKLGTATRSKAVREGKGRDSDGKQQVCPLQGRDSGRESEEWSVERIYDMEEADGEGWPYPALPYLALLCSSIDTSGRMENQKAENFGESSRRISLVNR